MKMLVRLRLIGCEIEFVRSFGPGVLATAEVYIDPLETIESRLAMAKAQMLDQLFDLEYLDESQNDKSLEVQRFDPPAVIYVQ